MQKILITACVLGAIGIVIGALGAHSLRPHLNDVQFNSYETGVRYQFFHTIMVFICGIFFHLTKSNIFKTSAILFLVGIVLFSGSIYLLATRELTGIKSLKVVLGPITPIGGLVLIIAWLSMAWAVFQNKTFFKTN